jgi:hypothetical protein
LIFQNLPVITKLILCIYKLKISPLFTFAIRRTESESRAINQGQTAALLIHKNVSVDATKKSSETPLSGYLWRFAGQSS